MKKILLTLATALFATTAFAQLNYSDVFPADFSNGLPTGWAVFHDASVNPTGNGIEVTCSQSAPNYRADLKYNMSGDYNNNESIYFNIDASKYKVFAIKFVGKRPESGSLKLSNIGLVEESAKVSDPGWIKGKEGYSLSESGWKDIEDVDGNHTYYWTIGGDKWTGNLTVKKIEIVIADIKNVNENKYTISEINWYESEDALMSTVTTKSVVENKTTSVKYPDFMPAYNAAGNNDVLILLTDVILTDRFPTKNVVLEGATGSEKIMHNRNDRHLVNAGGNRNMTIRNLVFEPILGPGNTPAFEHQSNGKNNHTLKLENVTLNKVISSSPDGLFNIKQGCLALKDVKFNNCSASKLAGFVNIKDANSLSLSGANEGLKVYVSAYNSISANELSNETPIELTLADTMLPTVANESITRADEDVNAIVTGCNDASKFKLTNEGYKLVSDGNGNLVLAQDTSSAVETIEVDKSDAPVEYYNLQGVKVTNPEKGIYIMRQGTSVRKVIL